MTRFLGGAPTLLLALALVSVGCIGLVPAPGDETAPTEPARSQAAEHDQTEAENSTFVALTLAFELTKESRSAVTLEGLSANPLPEGPSAFVPREGKLHPGQHKAMAALAVEQGTVVRSFTLDLVLRDGLGEATLSLKIADWVADHDTYETIRLEMPALGTVRVADTSGEVAISPVTEEAVPTYGYLLWPNGWKRVLPSFDHVVHVPPAYPKMEAGEQVAFHVEAGERKVTWTLDGQEDHHGEAYRVTVEPGRHTLALKVQGQDQPLQLAYAANDHVRYEDEVLLGTPDVETQVEGVNGNSHPLEILEDNRKTKLYLRPQGNASFEGDLDLYLADEDGQWVAKSTRPDTSYEHLEIRTTLPPGTYTLWVYSGEGAGISYVVQAFVQY